MNRFGDIDCSFKRLPPVYGFHSEDLVSLEEALQPIESQIKELSRYVKTAKKYCNYPNKHGLSKDQSATIYIYTMEWGETSLYRVLNQALRSENRQALKIWFPYLKLFDTALDLLPTVKEPVWRGIPLDIGKSFTRNQMFTWWSVSSCSSSVNVIEQFLQDATSSTLFLIEVVNGKNVSGYTHYETEDEVILKFGTEFRVKADPLKRPDGSHTVHLIEIQNDDLRPPTTTKNVNTDAIVLQMRNLMKEMDKLQEFTTPRYFFLLPAKDYDFKIINDHHRNLFNLHFKLYFLCECSNDPKDLHVASSDGYSIRKLKEFLMRFGQYLQITLNLVKVLVSIGRFVLPEQTHLSTNHFENIHQKINFAQQFLDKPETKLIYKNFSSNENDKLRIPRITNTHFEELSNYLERHDSGQFLGNLYRVITENERCRWFCQQHYDIISHQRNNDFMKQTKTVGGTFDHEKKELNINQMKFTNEHVKLLSKILKNGFIVSKLVMDNCSIYEYDFDELIDSIINRSSIQYLQLKNFNILNYFGFSKYFCNYAVINFSNYLLKSYFADRYQYANVQIFEKILSQNKIHRTLEISTCDFLQFEIQLQRFLDRNTMITELIVNHANNIEILNSIFQIKINKLERLKLNSSLGLPTVANHFCQLLKSNQTLIELNLIDSTVLSNADFLENLFQILKQHKSIKQLHLHISSIENSDKKENLLINYLQSSRSLSHLRLSKSRISAQLIRQFVDSIEKHHSLIHLEFHQCQFNENDVQQLKILENQGNLLYLLISQEMHQLKSNVMKWKIDGETIAGKNGYGDKSNQLWYPFGIYVDNEEQCIYIADCENHRIVKCKLDDENSNGKIVAGENGKGYQIDQLNCPTDVILDEKKKSLIISDRDNSRVVRWSLENRNGDKEILIENISCWGLMMNENGDLFVSDQKNHAVKRWRKGEIGGKGEGIIVAGGNGWGNKLNQLQRPTYIFIDGEETVYVSDFENHRVMKWLKGASEGIIVAGGHGRGNSLTQLNGPEGLIANEVGDVYVVDSNNHRIMCWSLGSKEGRVVVGGGKGQGKGSDHLNHPRGLSFDVENNLYVVDCDNHRIQRFHVDR